MAMTPTLLYRGQPASTTTTLYTVTNTAGKFAIIKHISVCNTTAAAATISFANVASGGSESDANRFLKDISVPAKTTVFFDLSMVMGQNESLRATASASTTFTVHASGVIN
jgi:hypothetical protein